MCQYHSTRPHNTKKLFMSSFQENSWKLGFWQMLIFDLQVNFLLYHPLPLSGAYLGKNGPQWPDQMISLILIMSMSIIYISESKWQRNIVQRFANDGSPLTPKKWPKMAAYEPKMAKNALWKIANQISKNNCNLFSSIFHVERPASRYGRLKLKFLCEWNSHCIYSFCSIELTKTRNARSVTAVLKHPYFSCNFVVWLF